MTEQNITDIAGTLKYYGLEDYEATMGIVEIAKTYAASQVAANCAEMEAKNVRLTEFVSKVASLPALAILADEARALLKDGPQIEGYKEALQADLDFFYWHFGQVSTQMFRCNTLMPEMVLQANMDGTWDLYLDLDSGVKPLRTHQSFDTVIFQARKRILEKGAQNEH